MPPSVPHTSVPAPLHDHSPKARGTDDLNLDPVPAPPPPQKMPLPRRDESSNPFMDDDPNSIRSVPGTTIQYRKPKAQTYGESFDPQAQIRKGVRVRFSDDAGVSKVQTASHAAATYSQPPRLRRVPHTP
ncbi:MAG: hypothetical protein AAF483_23535 [Planctomycetota bacterium]